MCIQAAPIVIVICKDITYVLVVFSSTSFKLAHLDVRGPLLSFDLSNRAIILFRLLILNRGSIGIPFRSSCKALRFDFWVIFGFHDFAYILQVRELEFSRWTFWNNLLNRSGRIRLDPTLVICLRRWVQCCVMLWSDSICCRARASIIVGPVTINLVSTFSLSTSLLAYGHWHRLSLIICHACPAVWCCSLRRPLVADISISIIITDRHVSETVLFL